MKTNDPPSSEDINNEIWNEEDTNHFIEFSNYFVPDREVQFQIISEMIPKPQKNKLILDICCGEGLLAETILKNFPECKVLALDGSKKMISRANSRLKKFKDRIEIKEFCLTSINWQKLKAVPHAVISSLAIHHLDDKQKKILFQNIFNFLSPGGVFIISDLVLPANNLGSFSAARQWDEAVRQQALKFGGDLKAFEKFKELQWNLFSDPNPDPSDKPSQLFDQLKWLNDLGFKEIDIYWMKAGHAIYGGTKPSLR